MKKPLAQADIDELQRWLEEKMRAAIEAEKADAIRQRDAAQQAANEAAALAQRAQQMGQEAAQKMLVASGAVQQCDAFLRVLEAADASPAP